MTNLGRGISVMPETIFFIGGEVIELLVANDMLSQEDKANAGYAFMLNLKENLLIVTKNISDMYSQAVKNMSVQLAHDLACEYLYNLALDVLDLKPKKSKWELIKEDENASPSTKAIITAIELATEDELVALYVTYPYLVDAFQSR